METMKVKPWGEGQGDHVVINAEDFNPEFHKKLDEPEKAQESEKTEAPKEETKEAPKPRRNRKAQESE